MRPNVTLSALLCVAMLGGSFSHGAVAAAGITDEQRSELRLAYSLMISDYYKPIAPQTLLDGARAGIATRLAAAKLPNSALPELKASGDQSVDEARLERFVDTLNARYAPKLGATAIPWAAISGIMDSVKDRYTVFLDPKEYAALNGSLDGGNFGGIGISIRVDDATKQLRVIDVLPGTPAERAGLHSGDTITAIDGHPTKGLAVDADSHALRGKAGTVVRLTVERDGKPLATPVSVARAIIHEPSVFAHMIDGNIGYARLSIFGADTAKELSDALNRLDGEGAKAIILDLRDNGGGYLNAAIDVSSKFIPSGPIVSVVSRAQGPTEYDAENTAIPPHPLAVLVNRYTASSSEITSGALQDDGVGTLVGERTFGKGVVQTIHPLPDGSAIKLTTASYLTPNGHDINLKGIAPDIVSAEPKNARFGDPKTDPQLQSAITFLRGQIAKRDG